MSGSTRRPVLALAAALALGATVPATVFAGPVADKQKLKIQEKVAHERGAQGNSQERVPFTAREAATAWPEGLPGSLRIAGDDAGAFQALIDGGQAAGDPWLVLSGGGENGAFGAGILSGWSKAGDRPAFGVITGVSTGALIAPFAFVGSRADDVLKQNYTDISAADVFEFGGTPDSLTDTWPLKARIEKAVTPDLLKAVAAEHAKGRRLLIATTQVDTERPTLWDMGAIATLGTGPQADRYGAKALKLFREVVLASTAVPGVFPPVMIDALAEDGKSFQEMHGDGGAMAPFYLAPAAAIAGEGAPVRLPAHTVYLVVNNKPTPDFQIASRSTLSVLGRTMSAAIKAQTQGALALTRGFAARTGLDLHVAEIDGRFTQTSSAPFDQRYMKALFAHGEAVGRDGTAFTVEAGPTTANAALRGASNPKAPSTKDLAAR